MSLKSFATIILGSFFIHHAALSQSDLRFWYGHSAHARINKEWRISASQLFIFKQNPLDLITIENNIQAKYRVNSRIRLSSGYQRSFDPFDLGENGRNRINARMDYYGNFENFRIRNTFRAEWHFPQKSKYEYRLRYAMRVHRKNLNLPLNARPFITNEFHYYLSGEPLWYRDNEGNRVVEQSTNGLHAHRVTLGLRAKPVKRTHITFSFIRQTEFNLGNKYRRINVEDPRNGKVRRKFNNYSVLSLTASYRFSL